MTLLTVSCAKEDLTVIPPDSSVHQLPELVEGEYVEWNLAPEGKARLCCGKIDTAAVKGWKICWYEIKDSAELLIDGAINNYYDVEFVEKGIRNLKCKIFYTDIEKDSIEVKEYPYLVAYTGLPTLYIDTENGQPIENKTDKKTAMLTLAGGGKFDDLNVSLEINGRGTTGWYGSPKKSYNLKFDSKAEVCGMSNSKKWALRDNYHDRTLLRDRYVSWISQNVFTNMGWQPSNINCDFVLNGEYKGCYVLTERIKIEKNRLDIPNISDVEDLTQGGFLCEIDERFDETYHFRTTHGVNHYNGKEGIAVCLKDPDEVDETTFEYVKNIVQTAENALYSEDFSDENSGYAHYFDLDALVDWYLIHEYVCMYDASSFYTSAYFYYNSSDNKLHMGPCWDFDTALRRDVTNLELREINSWYKRLFEDEKFRTLVKERWNQKKQVLKQSLSKLDEMADDIRVSADFNFKRWEVLGTPYDGQPTWDELKSYQDQVEFLKDWATNRIVTMDENINK